ncbi:SCO7613 C-terminal domain-containing membrane protein [Streptomyces sp. NPDC020681]|uniref:SCO7613 C-terminal domain-containing membrane protein n=1 Tax=Streptomyces sp. NPDC020681 TaxID=3365083 RepID=UPI00378FC0A1
MENVPPPTEELAILDRELVQLDARRAQLLARRAWLLTVINPPVAPAPLARPFAAKRPAETSPPNVQNLLLTLGGILLTIAAIAFTLVSWGHLGIGGRSAVLGAVTVAALATPVALLRRGLASTAEAVAGLGLVLMVLDAYALHRVALSDTGALAYSAVASAALAALWTAYGLSLSSLRTPLPVAALTAQLPLVLWSLAASPGAPPLEWALLVTAAADVAVAVRAKAGSIRGIAATAAATAGGWALLIGGWQSVTADSPSAAVAPAVLLVSAAAVALFAAWHAPQATTAASVVAGLAVIAAAGGVARAAVPEGWAVLAYLLCAVALLAAARTAIPARPAAGLTAASLAVHAAAALSALPLVALTLAGPLTGLEDIWSGPLADARSALGTDYPETGLTASPVVLLVVAAGLAAAAYWWPGTEPAAGSGATGDAEAATGAAASAGRPSGDAAPGMPGPGGAWGPWVPRSATGPEGPRTDPRRIARSASFGLGWAGLFVVPVALDLSYTAAVVIHLLLVLTALALTARPSPAVDAVALGCALAGGMSVALLALATRPATFTVLGVLAAAYAVAAVASRTGHAVRAVLACAAAVLTTALLGAVARAAELPPHQAALVILLVPAATALVAARLGRHPVALPLEFTGAATGLLAVALAAEDRPTLALVLALCGVIAAGTAVRAERRPAAGYLAAVLFVLATWVRLAASDVDAPEAYTLPVTVPALVVGALRRRRDPEASSWTAYGPGLAATLVPSLFAAWGDEQWLRSLLLGLAALAITLAGARLRLQALLVLGGTVLALDALHELAPYVVQAVGALPRWLPPALAGLLLLAVGATYEQRLRDARRLRDTLGRMR